MPRSLERGARPSISTPQQAHAACMALLPRHGRPRPPGRTRYTAMTPGRYIVCEDAPADPADITGWQAQAVLADGSGRSVGPTR